MPSRRNINELFVFVLLLIIVITGSSTCNFKCKEEYKVLKKQNFQENRHLAQFEERISPGIDFDKKIGRGFSNYYKDSDLYYRGYSIERSNYIDESINMDNQQEFVRPIEVPASKFLNKPVLSQPAPQSNYLRQTPDAPIQDFAY
jgi:hypothetical protein